MKNQRLFTKASFVCILGEIFVFFFGQALSWETGGPATISLYNCRGFWARYHGDSIAIKMGWKQSARDLRKKAVCHRVGPTHAPAQNRNQFAVKSP